MKKVSCPECNAGWMDDVIHCHSGIDSEGQGLIHMAWGKATELRAELTPDELRQHALGLLAMAEAAERDSMTVRYFMSTGRSFEEAAEFVFTLRQFRDDPLKPNTSNTSS